MKNAFFNMALVVFALVMTSATTPTTNESIPVKSSESKVLWTGYKVTGQHTGTIAIKSGNLDFDGATLTGGNFVIDMSTIKVTDLEGGGKQKLEGHLNSDDFFGVANHATASFVITKVVSRGTPGDYKVTGDITIKNITKEIKFLTNVKEMGADRIATADISIDRSDFDIRYGSGSFFDNLGDKTIYDEFELKIELKAGK